ncbi:MAG: DUF2125 domain-containing protein [Pseudomonadota bacterium]
MRIVVITLGALGLGALGWSGWWYAGASGQDAALQSWLDGRAAEGWQAEVTAIETTGFPARFARRIEAPALADPAAGWAWAAPWLEMESAAWDPTNVTLSFPEEQSFAVPGARLAVTAESLDAVAAVVPSLSLRLREVSLSAETIALDAQSGWRTGADQLSLGVARRLDDSAPPNTYDVHLEAFGVSLPGKIGRALTPNGREDALGTLTARGQVVADRPLDRDALDEGEIGARTVVIREGRLDYAGSSFDIDGRLDADEDGFAEGELDIEAKDWRRLVRGLVASGTIPRRVGDAIEEAGDLLSIFSRGKDINVTLTFSNGGARVGLIPVGRAPRLTTR